MVSIQEQKRQVQQARRNLEEQREEVEAKQQQVKFSKAELKGTTRQQRRQQKQRVTQEFTTRKAGVLRDIQAQQMRVGSVEKEIETEIGRQEQYSQEAREWKIVEELVRKGKSGQASGELYRKTQVLQEQGLKSAEVMIKQAKQRKKDIPLYLSEAALKDFSEKIPESLEGREIWVGTPQKINEIPKPEPPKSTSYLKRIGGNLSGRYEIQQGTPPPTSFDKAKVQIEKYSKKYSKKIKSSEPITRLRNVSFIKSMRETSQDFQAKQLQDKQKYEEDIISGKKKTPTTLLRGIGKTTEWIGEKVPDKFSKTKASFKKPAPELLQKTEPLFDFYIKSQIFGIYMKTGASKKGGKSQKQEVKKKKTVYVRKFSSEDYDSAVLKGRLSSKAKLREFYVKALKSGDKARIKTAENFLKDVYSANPEGQKSVLKFMKNIKAEEGFILEKQITQPNFIKIKPSSVDFGSVGKSSVSEAPPILTYTPETITIAKAFELFGQETQQAQKQRQNYLWNFKQIQKADTNQVEIQKTDTAQEQVQKSRQIVIPQLQQIQFQIPQQSTLQLQEPTQRQPQRQPEQQRIRQPETTPPINLLSPSISSKKKKHSSKKVRQAYNVLVRRFGKFKVISTKPLPKGRALRLGSRRVRETLGATFKIEEAGSTKLRDISFKPSKDIFRKNVKGEIIQKNIYRLSSPREVSEIQMFKKSSKKKKKKGGYKYFK